jgi:hypothetical protein
MVRHVAEPFYHFGMTEITGSWIVGAAKCNRTHVSLIA